MIQLHPEFLTKDGKKEFAVLPYELPFRVLKGCSTGIYD